MVEAIPMYPDSLVLVITKVDDPDELDTRFSRFTDDDDDFEHTDDDDMDNVFTIEEEDMSDIDLFDSDILMESDTPSTDTSSTGLSGNNSHNQSDGDFISLSEALGPEEFNKICNVMSEYGRPVHNMYASHSYYEEHYEPLIQEHALQVLASI